MRFPKFGRFMRLAVIPLALLLSGATFYNVASGATTTIDEHGHCRNVTNNHASGQAIFVPTNTSGEWTAFRDNTPPGVIVSACGCAVTPGSQSFATAGNHSFTVPCHNTLTVEVWGGGGGGAGCSNASEIIGSSGGTSNWNGVVIAGGGVRATASAGGAGGSGSGGTTNLSGQNGSTSSSNGAKGGNGANGGAGGAERTTNGNGNNATAPGGGGAGARNQTRSGSCNGDGGGGGGYSSIVYAAGVFEQGSGVPVVVGAAGAGGNGAQFKGGNGAVGRVTVSWN